MPERWLDGEEGEIRKDVKEASQPFSLGYRACIGRRYVRSKKCLFKSNMVNSLTCVVFSFAFMQMASIMAKLLFVYDLEVVGELWRIVLEPEKWMNLATINVIGVWTQWDIEETFSLQDFCDLEPGCVSVFHGRWVGICCELCLGR